MIRIGSEVEWDYCDGTERGRVIEIGANRVKVEYGPWGDTAWLPTIALRVREVKR